MPHVSKEGYRYICVTVDGKARYYLEHRWLMEQHLGRKLASDEVVHHLNENKLDNRLENLAVLTSKEHGKLHAPKAIPHIYVCPACTKEFDRRGRDVRGNLKKGKAGPFCSRECAGGYGKSRQTRTRGGTTVDPATWRHGLVGTYAYRGCRCDACKGANSAAKRAQRVVTAAPGDSSPPDTTEGVTQP